MTPKSPTDVARELETIRNKYTSEYAESDMTSECFIAACDAALAEAFRVGQEYERKLVIAEIRVRAMNPEMSYILLEDLEKILSEIEGQPQETEEEE